MDSKIVELARGVLNRHPHVLQPTPTEIELARAVIAMSAIETESRFLVDAINECSGICDCVKPAAWSLSVKLDEFDRLRRSAEGGK